MIIIGSIKELETAAMAFRLARMDVQAENGLKDLSDVIKVLDNLIENAEQALRDERFEESKLKF